MKKANKKFACPSLKESFDIPSCEDGTFESAIVGAIVSDFSKKSEEIGICLTLFGDVDKKKEDMYNGLSSIIT